MTTKLIAASAALGLCALPVVAQTPPPPAQQTPGQAPPSQTAPQASPVQTPRQQAPQARPGYYQFPQTPPAPQYPEYYQYPVQSPPPPPPQYVGVRPAFSEPLVRWRIEGGWSDPAGRSANELQGGYSVGLGMSIAPVSGSPFDFRLDVSYDRNDANQALTELYQNDDDGIDRGREEVWSGTLDLEFHLPLGGGASAYFFGGGGEYNMALSFREPPYPGGPGYHCSPYLEWCGFGGLKVSEGSLTKFGWNGGAGLEFPLSSGAKWFLEGRYNRIEVSNLGGRLAFIPVTVGLRF